MSKGRIYTLIVFGASFIVVFGGWFFTKGMLGRKEAEILSVKGQISMDISEADGNEDKGGTPVQKDFEGRVLSEEEMAEVLNVWEAGGQEIYHEPMAGQMNMEQAVKAGRDWINRLAENEFLPADMLNCSFESISAVLFTLDSEAPLEKSLISYWQVAYKERDAEIIIKIHAASGQIWEADISMNEDEMVYGGTHSEQELFAIAFPFLDSENIELMDLDYCITYAALEKGKVYAAKKRDSIRTDSEEPKARLHFELCTDIYRYALRADNA